jgi:uncharacterized protein (DUF1330 family)
VDIKLSEDIMNQRIALGITLLTGVAIGATAIQGLHAQGKPQAIVVVDISEITDPDGFKVIPASPATSPAGVAAQGGHYLARTDKITAFDGTPPKRFIVIAFDSEEKAKAWNNSASQNEINAIRAKTTKSRSFIVEAMSN